KPLRKQPRKLTTCGSYRRQLVHLVPKQAEEKAKCHPTSGNTPEPTSIFCVTFFTEMGWPLELVRRSPPTVPLTSNRLREGKGFREKLIIWKPRARSTDEGWERTRPLCELRFWEWMGARRAYSATTHDAKVTGGSTQPTGINGVRCPE
ncbi:hypothetical protein U0070_018835, partial [Myodes glareolus]